MPQTIDCIPFLEATVFHESLKKLRRRIRLSAKCAREDRHLPGDAA
jgi:hypothetical protein